MKFVIVLSVLIVIASCAPQYQQNQDVQVVNYVNENDGTGNYRFSYELTDGTKRDETGELRNVPGAEEPVVVMQGSYSFVDDQGKTHTVRFTADENGYHPIVE